MNRCSHGMRRSRGHFWFQSSSHVTVKQSSTCRAEGQCLSSLLLVPSDAGPCPATLMQSGGSQAALGQRRSRSHMNRSVINASVHPVETSNKITMKVFGVERIIKMRRRNGCRVLVITTTRVRACVSVPQIEHDAHSWSTWMSLTATIAANIYGRAGTKTRNLRAPWRKHASPQPAEMYCLSRRCCAWGNVSIKPRKAPPQRRGFPILEQPTQQRAQMWETRATNLGGVTSCYPLVTKEIQHHGSSA